MVITGNAGNAGNSGESSGNSGVVLKQTIIYDSNVPQTSKINNIHIIDASAGEVDMVIPSGDDVEIGSTIVLYHHNNTEPEYKVTIRDTSRTYGLSYHNAVTYKKTKLGWVLIDFSNDGIGRRLHINNDSKHVELLENYSLAVEKDSTLLIGNVDIVGSWRIRSEGMMLYFDRALPNGTWHMGTSSIGGSVISDGFVLDSQSTSITYTKGTQRFNLISPSGEHDGVNVGDGYGAFTILSTGRLMSAVPMESSTSDIIMKDADGGYTEPSTDYMSDETEFESDRYSLSITLHPRQSCDNCRISVINSINGNVLAENKTSNTYDVHIDKSAMNSPTSTFIWNVPIAFRKGTKYKIRIQTSKPIQFAKSSVGNYPAYSISKRSVEFRTIPSIRPIEKGRKYHRGDVVYLDMPYCSYHPNLCGEYVVTKDFVSRGNGLYDFAHIHKGVYYPGTITDNGFNFDHGNIGIGVNSPKHKLHVGGDIACNVMMSDVVNTKALTFTHSPYSDIIGNRNRAGLFVAESVGDGNDTNTLVLAHADDDEDTSTILNSASTINLKGEGMAYSSEHKFRKSSLKFIQGSRLQVETTFRFNSSSPTTIDFWVNIKDRSKVGDLISFTSSSDYIDLKISNGGLYVSSKIGKNLTNVPPQPITISQDNWYHIAMVCTSTPRKTTIRTFINGVGSMPMTINRSTRSFSLYIAKDMNMDFLMDELRISKERRYSGNFTPNDAPYGLGIFLMTQKGHLIELSDKLGYLVSSNR